MKTGTWAFLIGLVAVVGVVAAFATGGAEEAADETADNVFLGELDLAERMEIWRNQYRRMTPGDEALVQDVGSWPAAWEEFGSAWDAAPAERDLATWLVPVTAERSGGLTVLRDANGNALWSGQTDFAKDESAGVTITGALVDEEDWALYEAAREEVSRRWAEAARSGFPGMRGTNGPITNGLRFTDISVDTNGDYKLDFAWETDGDVQVFCRAMHYECWTNFGVVTTNDENQVVTNDVVNWRQVPGEKFMGIPDYWVSLGVTNVTNGVGSFTDTEHTDPLFDRVRFYAAAAFADSDNDGITDGEEWLWGISSTTDDSDGDGVPDYLERTLYHTDPYNPDTDGDGWTDGEEVTAQTDPLDRLSATRLARGVLVHGVKYSGDETNQWVQLHCSGPRRVDVSGFRVQAAGTSWQTVATLPENTWMTPGHFLLIGDEGVANADLTAALGLAGSYFNQPTAGVRLMAPSGSTNDPVDTMFYGMHVPFNEQGLDATGWSSYTTNLWAAAGWHLERWYLGLDTDMESDWRYATNELAFNSESILDTDGDDLTDEEEYVGGFNALNPDMDGDGLLDGVEIEHGLSPTLVDSDGDGTLDGDEEGPVPGQTYTKLQEARNLTAEVAFPANWSQGNDLGLYGVVSFQLKDIGGFAVLGTIFEGGNVAESYTVDVEGAASYVLWEKYRPGGFKTVKMFAVPNGTNEISVTVTDGGPNPRVTTPEEYGADIRAGFRAMKLDVEIGSVGEDGEENPGVFLANSMVDIDAPRTACRLNVSPRPPPELPGMLSLTWDSDILAVYTGDSHWGGTPLTPIFIPLGGFQEMNLLVEGLDADETDVFFRFQGQTYGQDVAHVICYEVVVTLSDPNPCDGEEVFVTIDILPQRVDSMFQGVVWTIEAPASGGAFDNPSGLGIEIESVDGNDKQWRIPNARWFASCGDPCYQTSYYELNALCNFDVFSYNAQTSLDVTVGGNCFSGGWTSSNYWAGDIVIHTDQTTNGEWIATVSIGTFHREITGIIDVSAPTNSQFYAMVLAEENAHAQQYGNPGSSELAGLWNAQNIIDNLANHGQFISSNAAAASQLASNAFDSERLSEEWRSYCIRENKKCAIEREAKQMAGSSHWTALKCTYPWCIPID